MDEKYLKGAYKQLGGQEKLKADFETWSSKIQSNEVYKQGMYKEFGIQEKTNRTYEDWNQSVFGLKKKDGTEELAQQLPVSLQDQVDGTPQPIGAQEQPLTVEAPTELPLMATEPQAIEAQESTIPTIKPTDPVLRSDIEVAARGRKREASKQFLADQETRATQANLPIEDYRERIESNIATKYLTQQEQVEFKLIKERDRAVVSRDETIAYFKEQGMSQKEIDKAISTKDDRYLKAIGALETFNLKRGKKIDTRVAELEKELPGQSGNKAKETQEEIDKLKASKGKFFAKDKDIQKIANNISIGLQDKVSQNPEKDILEHYHGLVEEGQQLADKIWNALDPERSTPIDRLISRIYKGAFSSEAKRLREVHSELRELAPIVLIDRKSLKEDNAWTQLTKALGTGLFPSIKPYNLTEQEQSQIVQGALQDIGISPKNVQEVQKQALDHSQRMTPGETMGQMTGTTLSMIPQFVAGAVLTSTGVGAAEGLPIMGNVINSIRTGSKAKRITRMMYRGFKGGVQYKAGAPFATSEAGREEASFTAGALGAIFHAPVAKALDKLGAKNLLFRAFGNNAPKVVRTINGFSRATAGGLAEIPEEYGNELGQIMEDSGNMDEFYSMLKERFGTVDQNLKFGAQVFTMGFMFGGVSSIGQRGSKSYQQWYDQQTSEVQEFFNEKANDIKTDVDEAINEQIIEKDEKSQQAQQPQAEVIEDVSKQEIQPEPEIKPETEVQPKEVLDDSAGERGIPGPEQKREEPGRTVPDKTTGPEEVEGGRVLQEPKQVKKIYQNKAIFSTEKAASESIAKKTFTEEDYQKISFTNIDKETKRIIKENDIVEVQKAAIDLNNDMNNALRKNLLHTLAGQQRREGDLEGFAETMDTYKKIGTEDAQSTAAGQLIRSNPEFTINKLLSEVVRKTKEVQAQPLTEGRTVGQEIESSFESIQKAIESKTGISIKKPTKERLADIHKRRASIKTKINQDIKKSLKQLNDFTSVLAQSATLGADLIKLAGTYIEEGVVRIPDLVNKMKADLGITSVKDKRALEDYLKKNINLEDIITKELIRTYGRSKIKQKRSTVKSDTKKIMEAMEGGAFNSQMYTQLVAEKFGVPAISQADIENMSKLAETIGNLDGGSLKARKLIEFNSYIEGLKRKAKRSKDERFAAGIENILDAYYIHILSGISTISRAGKGATMTSMAKTFVKMLANPKAAKLALQFRKEMFRNSALWRSDAAKEVYRSGFSPIHFVDTDVNKVKQGSRFMDRLANQTTKEILASKDYTSFKKGRRIALKYFETIPIMMYRTLLAMDVMMRAPMVELFTYMNEYERLMTQGRPASEKAFAKKLINAMGSKPEVVQKAEAKYTEEAKYLREEGITVPPDYKKTRINELIEQTRNQDATERAKRMADEALLMNDPEGWLGGVYRRMSDFGSVSPKKGIKGNTGALLFKMIFPILRVPTNFINTALDYTPVGFTRAYSGKTTTRTGDRYLSPSERRELNIKATMGMMVGATVLTMIFDWDDEEGLKLNPNSPIEVTAKGKGSWFKNTGMPSGYKTNSWRVKKPNGEWSDYYSFVDNPMGMILAPAGHLSDEIRYKKPVKPTAKDLEKEERGAAGTIMTLAMAAGNYATSQSYSQGVKDVSRMLSGEEAIATKAFEKTLKRSAQTPLPNFYKQWYKQMEAYRDSPEKDPKGFLEKVSKDIPLWNDMIDNIKYDHFGYPVIRKFEIPLIPDLLLDAIKENRDYRDTKKQWKLVHKFPEVDLGSMPKAKVNWTPEQTEKFYKAYGAEFKRRVDDNYETLNKLDAFKLQAKLSYYKSKAMAKARKTIKK